MSCSLCYTLSYQISTSYLIPAGLAPNTSYYIWVYKPNSQVYTYQITSDSSGDITILSSLYPVGFFNQYGGNYQVELSTDVQGQNLVNMMFSVLSYQCVLLTFLCCDS